MLGSIGPKRPEGWSLKRNLWVHWGGSRSDWVSTCSFCEGTESCDLCPGVLYHAQIQMVPPQESRVSKQSSARLGNKSDLYSPTVTVWGETLELVQSSHLMQVGRAFKSAAYLRLRGAFAEEHVHQLTDGTDPSTKFARWWPWQASSHQVDRWGSFSCERE